MEIFHERLKAELKRCKISQSELARKLGVKQSSMWLWLNKEWPSLERFKQICLILGSDPAFLLGLDLDGGGGRNFPREILQGLTGERFLSLSVVTITSRIRSRLRARARINKPDFVEVRRFIVLSRTELPGA